MQIDPLDLNPYRNLHDFWELVALAGRNAAAFLAQVQALDDRELTLFYWTCERAANEIKTERYVEHIDPELSEARVDALAQWAVWQGRDYFLDIFEHPHRIRANIDSGPNHLDHVVEEYRRRHSSDIPDLDSDDLWFSPTARAADPPFVRDDHADRAVAAIASPVVRELVDLARTTVRMRALGLAEVGTDHRLPTSSLDMEYFVLVMRDLFTDTQVIRDLLDGRTAAQATGWAVSLYPFDALTDFWGLVSVARSAPGVYGEALASLSDDDLVLFYWTYERVAAELKGDTHVANMPSSLSEDGINDLAQWIVGQGRDYYLQILEHPDRMPREAHASPGYMGTAVAEYERRHGETVPFLDDEARWFGLPP